MYRTMRAFLFLVVSLTVPVGLIAQDAIGVELDRIVEILPISKRSMSGEVVYGRKAEMALTYDTIQLAEPKGAGVIFVVSGLWNSNYFPLEDFHQILRGLSPETAQFLVQRGRHRRDSQSVRQSPKVKSTKSQQS